MQKKIENIGQGHGFYNFFFLILYPYLYRAKYRILANTAILLILVKLLKNGVTPQNNTTDKRVKVTRFCR